jgi:hypothetical protein
LFPATFLAHIAEEYWGGFAARTQELTGLVFPEPAFLAANALFWVLMCGAVILVFRRPSRELLVVALGIIVTINAALHAGGALLSKSYSPGLGTGVVLWLPLGVAALVYGHRLLPTRSFRTGVVIGIVVHAAVPIVGLAFALAFGGGLRAV